MFLFSCNAPKLCREKISQVIIMYEKGVLQLCSEHTVPALGSTLNVLLSLTCTSNENTTNSRKNNRFFCRKCVLCGFLVPAAFRPQSSEKEAALAQAAQMTWSIAGP